MLDININPISLDKIQELLILENICFPIAWSEEDFRRLVEDKRNIALVAELDDKIVGYVLFEIVGLNCKLSSVAVLPNMRRKKIGSTLVRQVLSNMLEVFNNVSATASERNLDAQLFFRNLGFKAVQVSKDFYGKNHDGYNFVYFPDRPFLYNKEKQLDEICKGI